MVCSVWIARMRREMEMEMKLTDQRWGCAVEGETDAVREIVA